MINKSKKIIALILVGLIAITNMGCSNLTSILKRKDIRRQTTLTEEEMKILYKEEREHKVDVKRNIKYKTIEWLDVDDDTSNLLWNKTLGLLDDYKSNIGYSNLTKATHDYLKFNIDNLELYGDPEYVVAKNDGYYYVSVTWKTRHKDKIANFKFPANYVGIVGALGTTLDEDNKKILQVDDAYLETLIEEVNKKREEENIDPLPINIEKLSFIGNDEIILDNNDELIEETKATNETNINISTDSEIEEKQEQEEQEEKEKPKKEEKVLKKEDKKNNTVTVRRLLYNCNEFNHLGAAINAIPIIPPVQTIFDVEENPETIGGYSLYKEGQYIDEVKRSDGKINIIFVYKHNLETDNYDFKTLYLGDYITDDMALSETTTIIPEYKMSQLKIVVEEVNRLYANKDICGFASGEVILPQDLALQMLLQRDSTVMSDNELKIKKVCEVNGNEYIVELEQITIEQPPKANSTASKYLKKYYALINLVKNKFVLQDLYLYERRLLKVPEFDIDNGIKVMLYTSRTMSNEITDEVKNDIRKTIKKLEIGMLNRRGYDLLDNEGNIVVRNNIEQWGVFSRFDDNRTILSEENLKSYLNDLNGRILKYGAQQPCIPTMNISQWLVGNEKQVEIIINELYDYKVGGEWVKRFVVLSNLKNNWVIDEMRVLEQEELTPNETKSVYNDMVQGTAKATNNSEEEITKE